MSRSMAFSLLPTSRRSANIKNTSPFPHAARRLVTFVLLLTVVLNLLSCKPPVSRDAVTKFMENYVTALKNDPASMNRYVHPESSWGSPNDLARRVFKHLTSQTELMDMQIIRCDSNQAQVKAILRITSRMAAPPGFPPLEEQWSIMFILKPDTHGDLKIFSEQTIYTERGKGVDIPKLRSNDVTAQVCAMIDRKSSAGEIVDRLRKRFGRIAKERLTADQLGILNVIAIASSISIGASNPSAAIDLRSSVHDTIPIEYSAVRQSNVATPFLIRALSSILPDLVPDLSVLVVNDTYLIPLIRKQTIPQHEFIGYDLIHPDNLLIQIDPTYTWIKTRFNNVTHCAIADSTFTQFILTD